MVTLYLNLEMLDLVYELLSESRLLVLGVCIYRLLGSYHCQQYLGFLRDHIYRQNRTSESVVMEG